MKNNEEFWKPEENESIEGVFIEITDNIGKYGSRIYKIRTDDKTFCVWESVELRELFENVNPEDRIYLKYLGTEESGEYPRKKYDLKVL